MHYMYIYSGFRRRIAGETKLDGRVSTYFDMGDLFVV